MNVVNWLVDMSALTPHGFCLLWNPAILWIDAVSDGATMLAYFSIPLALLWFARRRPDLPHRWIGVLFVCFIVACGITHGFSILTLWVPAYTQEAMAKLLTAILSIGTAIILWPLVPKLVLLPSPGAMAILNEELTAALAEQRRTATRLRESEKSLLQAQEILRRNNELLEQRVAERTAELQASGAELRKSQMLLKRTSTIAGVGGWEFDLATQTGSCSEETYRILRIDPTVTPSPQAADALLTQQARPLMHAAVQQALQGGDGWDHELTFIRGDGTPIWLRTIGAMEREDGKPTAITGAIQDITERVQERDSLHLANERLSLATHSCGIGIWDWDIANQKLVWDRKLYALLGLPNNRPAGIKLWRSVVHPDDRRATQQDLRDALAGVKPYESEFRIIWDDGTTRHARVAGRVTFDASGRAARMVGAAWDVTESHAAEEMRLARDAADRASRAKSDFLATMSHEIRSPLGGLLGVVDLLRETVLDSEQSRMLGMVHGSASMLLAVLNDILDFSKIEAGAMSIAPEPMALRRFIDDLVQPHTVTAGRRGLRLGVSVDPALPQAITTDPLRLQQILGNLIANAVKFTARGEVTFTVGLDREATLPILRFAVRDTGIGIPEDVLGRLFQPFTQADGSTTRNYGGTGLGLSISKKLAQLLSGDISATSTEGAGSEFVLRLPLVSADTLPEAVADIPQALRIERNCHVLLVDDDPTIRWLTQRQLEKLGVPVEHASDGAAGLRKLGSGHYDIILTDCHMPNMDGVALTKAVRALPDPALCRMPIVGLTADVTEAQRLRCADAGMTDLAIKPLTLGMLAQLLVKHLPTLASAVPPVSDAGAAGLASVAFDEQLYLAVFEPGDQEGAAWLREYLDVAREDYDTLASMAGSAIDVAGSSVASIAHRLAGASFSAGAILLGEAARAMETAALAKDPIALADAHVALATAHAAAQAAIPAFIARTVDLPAR